MTEGAVAPSYPPLSYPFGERPPAAQGLEVAPGILWLRLDLPFRLNHVNLWLLADGDGWFLIDTGYGNAMTEQVWHGLIDTVLDGKPITRVLVTHYHPDHAGMAGWLVERFSARFLMPKAEWLQARMLYLDGSDAMIRQYAGFYRACGLAEERVAALQGRGHAYRNAVHPIPPSHRSVADGDRLRIGGRDWRVITGGGHALELSCLHAEADGILISGDQILPKISPNVSVFPMEPEGDPLAVFLASLARFKTVAPDSLILPSHGFPFHGLHARIDDLIHHHDLRLAEVRAAVTDRRRRMIDIMDLLFPQDLDTQQLFFAMGEAVAHVNHLFHQGMLVRDTDADGVWWFGPA